MKENKHELKQKFIEMRAKDISYDKISKQLGVSKQTLINWSKEFNIEISNLKAIEHESLIERYRLKEESSFKQLSDFISKIEAELEQRELKDVPTEKIFNMYCKHITILQKRGFNLEFKETKDLMDKISEPLTVTNSWPG